jgi:predicted transcriptional regulator
MVALEEKLRNSRRESLKKREEQRSRFEITADVLFVARYGATITEIGYKANLNPTQVKSYIDYLEEEGLLEESGPLYKLTERGKEFLRRYQMVKETLTT